MDNNWKQILWRQFGACIDMLENALRACPDELWGDRGREPQFWYLVYHTLFWLDLYLSGAVEGFAPPAPFKHGEIDTAGPTPPRVYTREELQTYLDHCRRKCRSVIESLTDERAAAPCVFRWGRVPFAELLLYNLRHVQHHSAQLNLLLRQQTDSAPAWVAQAREE